MSIIVKFKHIKYAISPDIFSNKENNYRDIIKERIKQFYTKNVYDNEYIIEIQEIFMDNIKNPIIDPISGNMLLEIPIKCKCFVLKNGDKLRIKVINIISQGIMGTSIEYDIVKTLITKNILNNWTFDTQKNEWTNNHTKEIIKVGSVIDVSISSWRFEKNSIKCFVKFI